MPNEETLNILRENTEKENIELSSNNVSMLDASAIDSTASDKQQKEKQYRIKMLHGTAAIVLRMFVLAFSWVALLVSMPFVKQLFSSAVYAPDDLSSGVFFLVVALLLVLTYVILLFSVFFWCIKDIARILRVLQEKKQKAEID